MNIGKFVEERDNALRSLDRQRIESYARKYGVKMPKDDLTFWLGVHKARLLIARFTEEEKTVSREWIEGHGFKVGVN